jgi:hypothetical protein
MAAVVESIIAGIGLAYKTVPATTLALFPRSDPTPEIDVNPKPAVGM